MIIRTIVTVAMATALWAATQILSVASLDDGHLKDISESRAQVAAQNWDSLIILDAYPKKSSLGRMLQERARNPSATRMTLESSLQELAIRYNKVGNLSDQMADVIKDLRAERLGAIYTKFNILAAHEASRFGSSAEHVQFLADMTIARESVRKWEDDLKRFQDWHANKEAVIGEYSAWLEEQARVSAEALVNDSRHARGRILLLMSLVGVCVILSLGLVSVQSGRKDARIRELGRQDGIEEGKRLAHNDFSKMVSDTQQALAQGALVETSDLLSPIVAQFRRLAELDAAKIEDLGAQLKIAEQKSSQLSALVQDFENMKRRNTELMEQVSASELSSDQIKVQLLKAEEAFQEVISVIQNLKSELSRFSGADLVVRDISGHLINAAIIASREESASAMVAPLQEAQANLVKLLDKNSISTLSASINSLIKVSSKASTPSPQLTI